MRNVRLLPAHWTMALIALCGAGLWTVSARPAAGQGPTRPQRIVSLNLCADQLLVALADRGQIAGLTHNAPDPSMSAIAAIARRYPVLRDSIEEVVAIRPDLVLGAPGSGPIAALLRVQPTRVVDLPPADSLDDIAASIRIVARAVGHPERGEALIAAMARDLAALPRTGHGAVAAYYQRRGYLTGTGTLIDDLMRRTGLVNLAAKLGKPPLSQMSLEEMIAARPDYLIVESDTDKVTDQGTEMLHHPALRSIPRISIPQAWTVCGGPAYVKAARLLSTGAALRQLHQKRARTPP